MKAFDLQLLRRFWRILKLYWFSEEKWFALSMLVGLIILSISITQYRVQVSIPLGDITSALAGKDFERFSQALMKFLVWHAIAIPLLALSTYMRDKLALNWRRWLTYDFLRKYLNNRGFYKINYQQNIDNPDQRIAEDINTLTTELMLFIMVFMDSIFKLIGFGILLWSISPALVIFIILYAVVITLIGTGIFGQKLVKLNFEQSKQEANFRFGLLRIRNYAESIAFYQAGSAAQVMIFAWALTLKSGYPKLASLLRHDFYLGETGEIEYLTEMFQGVLQNKNTIIIWWMGLKLFEGIRELGGKILPSIIMAPVILSGQLEIGALIQGNVAFTQMISSVNVIINQLRSVSALVNSINRLEGLDTALELAMTNPEDPKIQTKKNDKFVIENLTVQTPDRQKTLWQNLSVEVPQNQGMLVVGASGCGKSSLLRAIAGLWDSGSGVIHRPPLREMLFLPQVPYMVLGSLRNQFIYPHTGTYSRISDDDIYRVLHQVNLLDIVERSGGLDALDDWSRVLSLGEQQRLYFSRVLLHKHRYAVLDEATSALDVKSEQILYEELQKTATTFISVGHRPTLFAYHSLLLELSADGVAKVRSIG